MHSFPLISAIIVLALLIIHLNNMRRLYKRESQEFQKMYREESTKVTKLFEILIKYKLDTKEKE